MNSLILKNEATKQDIRTILLDYLETIPEITSCIVDIQLNEIQICKINNTNFRINSNIEYFAKNTSELYNTDLLQSNIKQSLAIEISTKLIKCSALLIDLLRSRQLQDSFQVCSSHWQYTKKQSFSRINLIKDNT